MGPIRIAVVIGKISYGGIENVVANYYRVIDKSKVQFDFYYGGNSLEKPKQEFLDLGARYFKLPPVEKPLAFKREFRQYLKKNIYKIVHVHMNTLSFLAIDVAWKEGVPVRICHNHSVPSGEAFFKKILKNSLKFLCTIHATDMFACSEKSGRWFYGNKVYDQGKVHLMSNAIDLNRFHYSDDKRCEIRKKLNIQDKLVIGHVGRFTYAKNHLFLLDVFSEVLTKAPNAVLVLVGDGELKTSILKKIKDLNLQDKVILVGQSETPEYYYLAFDVMAFPSVFEGLPVTVVECQASLRPIVVSDVVPDEAIFSDGVYRCSLDKGPSVWAEQIIATAGKLVRVDERKNLYDIFVQAQNLCSWYVEKASEI